jgi:predicted metal-binding membrane protein
MLHGADSIGCCWALMLVMFGIGVGNLGWMAALTGVMLGEAMMPSDRAGNGASRVVGAALFVLAGLWLAHPAWLGAATVS